MRALELHGCVWLRELKAKKYFAGAKVFLILPLDLFQAWVAELVDALDSKSSSFESAGSIPAPGTKASSK